jgi:hypothetical protein
MFSCATAKAGEFDLPKEAVSELALSRRRLRFRRR